MYQTGHFFFIITSTKIFYLIFAEGKFPDRLAFDLIEELQGDEKKFLKNNYKFNIESLIETYENKEDSLQTAQTKINDVKNDVSISLHKMIGNMEILKVL